MRSILCVVPVLIAMWFPGWLQARRDAERKKVQIKYVVPPAVTTAAVSWN